MIREWADELARHQGLDPAVWGVWLYVLIRFTIVATVFAGVISVIAMFSIWWERKIAGHIQSRVGPMHVGGWHGWAQSLADGIKLILKEDLMPAKADSFLFKFAPYMAFAPVFAAFLALPFSPQWVFEAGFNIGVLYLLAVLAIEAMGTIMAGWGSASKWSVYGAMREACQIVSYEIPLGISILCGVLVAGTLNLVELGYLQGRGIWDWLIFHNPFLMVAFLLFFIASLAASKRAPFDLPESESELVAGFHTEYSGIRWSFFFFAEYGAMFIVGAIQAYLFLGGWNSPLGVFDPVYIGLGYEPVAAGLAYYSGALQGASWGETAAAYGLSAGGLVLLNIYGVFWFAVKAMGVIFLHIWIRWTLPRIRIDQVLHACVKVLLPISIVTLLGTAVWIWLVPQPAAVTLEMVGGGSRTVTRLGHLASTTPWLQALTQLLLMLIGVGIVLFFVGVVVWAWINRDQMPRKTIFADVMPVGDQIAFTAQMPAYGAAHSAAAAGEDEDEAQPAPAG